MTYDILQNYWWLIISLLGALLVLLLFVQGGQTMMLCYRDKTQRNIIANSLGRKWEFTFTTLVTFGGAFFASFPLFYSTSFGGAYWLWMIILFSFIIQAISYEYRRKEGNVYGTRFYDVLLLINGIVGPLLLGVAVAMMFFGAEFTVTKSQLLNAQSPVISSWGAWHGLEAMVCWKNLLFGLMVLMLARTLASLYFINNIDDKAIVESQHKHLLINASVFVLLFLVTASVILLSPGVRVNEGAGAQWVPYLYLNNLLEMWWVAIVLLLGVVAVLYGIVKTLLVTDYRKGIWWTGAGTVLVVLALLWTVGYNDTAYYPSLIDPNSSLTIRNSSSSQFTLQVMSIVSLLVPFVLAYIVYAWRSMDRVKITAEEIEQTPSDDLY